MLFNSLDFAVFLPVVFFLYWFVAPKHLKLQNALIVCASAVFYGWWDWRFLGLIFISSLVDFWVGLKLAQYDSPLKRKALLALSIFANLGILGLFKYYNFFLANLATAFAFWGRDINVTSLSIVLPVGISFYTFQTMSYSIDVYKRKLEPTSDFIAFSAFVSFFPQLVAGPIERAANLLPQFYRKRIFDYDSSVNGCRQMLWGFFKKIVIADNCAVYANMIFNNSSEYSGSTLVLGAIFFSFQIYGDFSGYSDIAVGLARLFGFNLMKNFAFPYFSRDIAEFWRRWHISLSTWFKDYLYIPLGGGKGGNWLKIRNTFVIFLVSGFWHGANWTFVTWGVLHALYFLPLMLLDRNRKNLDVVAEGKLLPSFREFASMSITFGLTTFAWIFFRCQSLSHAFSYVLKIFSVSLFSIPDIQFRKDSLFVLLLIFLSAEWLGRRDNYAIECVNRFESSVTRKLVTYGIALTIIMRGNFGENTFIYFQF
ncbi:MAG: membrane-bound O-acyltransferase family protein [Candidatus Riflebacteria bacterium HGW-Riflebacteria-1]|nr:MAG: membrane-bound O-acyltransferase family protein [Candidatus Riflebacteria bacterium HGW-Riflebacteria-1]